MNNKKTKQYKRKVSGNEKLYSSCEKIFPPFCVQLLIEGSGKIETDELKKAVQKVAVTNPDSTVILKGSFWQSTTVFPSVTELSAEEFDTNNLNNPYFRKRIDFINGPSSEIYLLKGNNSKMLFRSFHGVMDARGLLLWVENIFNALNHRLLSETNTEINDSELLEGFKNKEYRKALKAEYPSLTGQPEGNNISSVWVRERIPGNYTALVSKLAYILSAEAGKYSKGKNKFMVPVDLRNQAKGLYSFANLSNPLFIETDGDESWLQIYENIIRQLKNNNEKKTGGLDKFLYSLPGFFIGKGVKILYNNHLKSNNFFATGIISHIGKINHEIFSTVNFKAESLFFLPFDVPGSPITIATVENEDFVEMSVSMPECLANGGRLDNLVTEIKYQLQKMEKENRLIFDEASFNNTFSDYPFNKTIFELFEEQAVKNPGETALIYDNNKLTYGELYEKSCNFASVINQEKYNKTETLVIAIILEHSFDTVISILGVLKAGHTYLPVSPEAPAERISYLLEDSGASILITQKKFKEKISFNGKVIEIEDLQDNLSEEPVSDNYDSESLAYLIYTSGSTGLPKGVEITNKNLVNYCWWAKNTYLETNEKYFFPLYTSLAFDLTVTSIFVPLISGNSICIYQENANALNSIIKDNKVNIMKLTPTHLKLLKEIKQGDVQPALEKIIVGGEAFPVSLAKNIYEKFQGNIDIYNEYGPTETTVGCMIYRFNPEQDKGHSVPIGKPVANTFIYLLNKNMEPVKPGVSGEIYISGDGVAKGYHNRDKLNEKVFLSDPFRKGYRMYRTGDLAVTTINNNLEYSGRNDEQIKIRGYRIEPSEIENIISSYPGIKKCLVTVFEKGGETKSRFLTAYYVAEQQPDPDNLKAFLSSKLPDYMVPAFFIQLDDIPLTVNGKADKKALPDPETAHSREEVNEDELTMKLILILADIINMSSQEISPSDSLFEMGCDSLIVAIYLTRISEQLLTGKEDIFVKLEELIKEPTINNLARIIREYRALTFSWTG